MNAFRSHGFIFSCSCKSHYIIYNINLTNAHSTYNNAMLVNKIIIFSCQTHKNWLMV